MEKVAKKKDKGIVKRSISKEIIFFLIEKKVKRLVSSVDRSVERYEPVSLQVQEYSLE